MLVLTIAFNTVAGHRLQHQADDELRTRAAAVATTIDTSGPTVPESWRPPTTTSWTPTSGSTPDIDSWRARQAPAP
jgi:hypothetical protein